MPNKQTKTSREYLIKHSRGLDFLCDLTAGRKIQAPDPDDPTQCMMIYPPVADRVAALRILADKLVPSLKSSEVQLSPGEGTNLDFTVRFVRPDRQPEEEWG